MKGQVRQRNRQPRAVLLDVGRDFEAGEGKQLAASGARSGAEVSLTEKFAEMRRMPTASLLDQDSTVGEYLEWWLLEHAAKLSLDTYKSYDMIVHKHLIPFLGRIRLKELRPLQIQAYLSHALSCGNLRRGGGLSRRTVQYHYAVLHKALRHAVKWELLHRNPADAVDAPSPQRRKAKVLPADLLPAFLEAIKETGIYYVPLLLAVTTGMRREEILGLRWEDVELERGLVRVTQVLKRENRELCFRPPKTEKSYRTIVLLPSTVDVLIEHRTEQERTKAVLGGAYRDYGLVCCRKDGRPIVPDTFSSFFRDWIERHPEFPRITLHGLRHTHATSLMELGVHPKIVSERLGHSTINITLELYTHYLPHLQKEAAERLDLAINPGCRIGTTH